MVQMHVNRHPADKKGLTELGEVTLNQDYLRNVRERRDGVAGGRET